MNTSKNYFDYAERLGRVVDGVDFATYMLEINDANILEVEVGTTGYKGGDSGHGGRTYFRVKDGSSTDIRCTPMENKRGVEIILGGDAELDTFIEALEFAVFVLKWQKRGFREDDMKLSDKERRQMRFRSYLFKLIRLYHDTGKLSGMSSLCREHKVSGITQAQFFEMGLHKAAAAGDFLLSDELSDAIYEYILDHTKTMPEYGVMKM